jgi:hypothetical protein
MDKNHAVKADLIFSGHYSLFGMRGFKDRRARRAACAGIEFVLGSKENA